MAQDGQAVGVVAGKAYSTCFRPVLAIYTSEQVASGNLRKVFGLDSLEHGKQRLLCMFAVLVRGLKYLANYKFLSYSS
jgi:hypothetical protein